jgi:hypothetical protein
MTQFHVVKNYLVIPLLPHTSSWCGTSLNTGTNYLYHKWNLMYQEVENIFTLMLWSMKLFKRLKIHFVPHRKLVSGNTIVYSENSM